MDLPYREIKIRGPKVCILEKASILQWDVTIGSVLQGPGRPGWPRPPPPTFFEARSFKEIV